MKKYNKFYFLLMSSFLIVSCNQTTDLSGINKTLGSIKDDQKTILRRLEAIEKSQNILKTSIAGINKPSGKDANKKQQQPQADPNKVYNIPIGDSFVEGNPEAAVTIIEWSDFQ